MALVSLTKPRRRLLAHRVRIKVHEDAGGLGRGAFTTSDHIWGTSDDMVGWVWYHGGLLLSALSVTPFSR